MHVQSLPHHQYALQLLSNGVLVLLSEVLAQQLINLLHTSYQQNDKILSSDKQVKILKSESVQ